MVKKFLVLSSLCVFALLSMEPNNSHNSQNNHSSNNKHRQNRKNGNNRQKRHNHEQDILAMAFNSDDGMQHFTPEQQEAIRVLLHQNQIQTIAQLQRYLREYKNQKYYNEQQLEKLSNNKSFFSSWKKKRLQKERKKIENNWNARKRELLGC